MCNFQGPTLVIIQSKEGYLFGGYTTKSWAGDQVRKQDHFAFIFTLSNPHAIPPTRYQISPSRINFSIYCDPACCAAFGMTDIYVSNSSSQNMESCTNFPHSFVDTTGKGNLTFTGNYNFSSAEIEVYVVN